MTGTLRGDLNFVRNVFFWLLLACTIIVAIGVFLESNEHWLPEGKSFFDPEEEILRPDPRIRIQKRFAWLGWALIFIGVIGEGAFEGLTTNADSALQDFNNTLLAITTEQARSAAESARQARKELAAVEQDTETLREQLGEEFAELGLLRKDVNSDLPRGVLLSRSAPKLVKVLAPFAGLSVVIFMSGPETVETRGVRDQLIRILGPQGAKCNFPRGSSPIPIGPSPFGIGLRVFVSTRATKKARDAARVLSVALAGILPPSTSNILIPADPVIFTGNPTSVPYGQEHSDNPFQQAMQSPDGIAIDISPHP